jgi:hypothetical protein
VQQQWVQRCSRSSSAAPCLCLTFCTVSGHHSDLSDCRLRHHAEFHVSRVGAAQLVIAEDIKDDLALLWTDAHKVLSKVDDCTREGKA